MSSAQNSSPSCLGNPFDHATDLRHHDCADGAASAPAAPHDAENAMARVAESAVVRAIFNGSDIKRRTFMKMLGGGTAMAVINSILPLNAVRALAADTAVGPLEKKDIKLGFMPIICGTPIIMAQPLGLYEKYGFKAEVLKASGWAMIRDWLASGQTDYTQMLTPMPMACSMGLGSNKTAIVSPAYENVNGQAITLRLDHKDVKEAKDMKGFTFGVPFDYSIHNLMLRYYLAEGGLNPDTDVQIRVINPAEMVANLKAGNIDGFLAPEPFNQRVVAEKIGFIHVLTQKLWSGHPCCAFVATKKFATEAPNSFKAMTRAVVESTFFCSDPANRADVAKAIAPRNYLNQPRPIIEQVLTGKYEDGLGNTAEIGDRVNFDPFPWQSMAVWVLTQMKRWGYISGDVDYKGIAEQVFLAADCAEAMRGMGHEPPASPYTTHTIMGKTFDPNDPEGYLASFAIKKS